MINTEERTKTTFYIYVWSREGNAVTSYTKTDSVEAFGDFAKWTENGLHCRIIATGKTLIEG